MNTPNIVAFIFARGGSKGVPHKNIRLLNGHPLISYAIRTGLTCPSVSRVVVSTDDEQIATVARDYDAEVPFMRPAELASDTASEWLAWQHAIQTVNALSDKPVDIFLSLPATAPLRAVEDVERCLNRLETGNVDLVFCVTEATRSPYFNMVTLREDGLARLVIPPPRGEVHRRQDTPAVYDMCTVAYAARPDYVLSASGLFDGRVAGVVVPVERALDIDTPWDFYLAELILRDREGRGCA
jgi:N-acylneuraminate cytidylyltransferase